MRKFLLFAQIFFIFAVPLAAQEKCEQPLSAAPALFNLRLGMSPVEARRAAGGRLSIKNKPESVYFRNYIKNSPPSAFKGVRVFYLRFFDSKLYQIEIFYQNEKGITLEEFVDDVSERDSLPRTLWKIEYGIAELNCDGFLIVADNFLNPRIELTDPLVKAEFDAFQEEKRERKKAEEK